MDLTTDAEKASRKRVLEFAQSDRVEWETSAMDTNQQITYAKNAMFIRTEPLAIALNKFASQCKFTPTKAILIKDTSGVFPGPSLVLELEDDVVRYYEGQQVVEMTLAFVIWQS